MKKEIRKQQKAYFKRWTRKRYAAFNSLKKIVVISAISLSCSFIFKPFQSFAQVEQDSIQKTIHLEDVGITAEDVIQTQSIQQALLQTSLTKKQIEHAPVQSLNELLDHLPGLDIRQRGAFGTQADISFRGGNFDQTLVLLNGINITDPQTGHYTMNIPVFADIIHRIEVFKNTSAFLFGTSPFSGVINFITQPDTVNALNLHLSGGMYGLWGGNAHLHLYTGKFSHLLALDYSHSDGYRKNTDFNIFSAFYQTIGKFKKGQLEIQSGYNDKAYGANSFYSLRFPNQFEHTRTLISSIQWQSKGRVKWIPSIYYRFNFDRFELERGGNMNNYHHNQSGGINLRNTFSSRFGKTSFSADYRMEDIISSSLGELLTQPIRNPSTDVDYTHRKTRHISGISAAHGYVGKHVIVNFSLLGQYYMYNFSFYVLPAADMLYRFQTLKKKNNHLDMHVFASAAKSMRMPTFTDLYYRAGDIIGNKHLKPEQAYTLESGFEMNLSRHQAPAYLNWKTAVFCRWGIDMIDYIKKGEDSVWQSVNHTAVFFAGWESSFEFLPEYYIGKNFPIQSIRFNYMYVYSDKQSNGFMSRYVLDHLTHKLTFTLSHRMYKNWGMHYVLSYNVRKGEYISYEKVKTGELKTYPPYTLLDIRMYYSFKKLYFYLEAGNVLNVKYYDLGGLDQAGIWIKGGIKYKITFRKQESRQKV